MAKPSRENCSGGALLLGAAAFGTLAYMTLVEPRWLAVERRRVALRRARLATPLRLLHLSDFHLSPYVSLSLIDQAIQLGLAEAPDLICVTGDFVTGRMEDPVAYGRVLARLPEAAPTFACLGNHDGGLWSRHHGGYLGIDEVTKVVEESGITLLTNQHATIEIHQQPIRVVGLGDLWADMLRPARELFSTDTQPADVVLLLAHNPDAKELVAEFEWDVMLCGHGHGGQLYLPGVGRPFAPVKDRRYAAGLNEWNGRWIHTTRGVGSLYSVRLNCRPEVSSLELA